MVSLQAWKNRLCIALVLGVVSMGAAVADPILSLSATPAPAVTGSTVDLNVQIAGIADLFAYQFTLSFDPTVQQASAGTEGAFLGAGGTTYFDMGTIDNTQGSISFAYNTLLGPVAGVSGSGSLAHFNFNVIHNGTTALTFSDVMFLDSNMGELTVQANNASLQAVPEPASYVLFGLGLAGLALMRRRETK